MARLPRLRHLDHRRNSRVRRSKRLIAWLAARVTALAGTGTAKNFTTDVEAATGTLTAAGNPAQNETVTIGSTVYTFKTNIEAQAATGVLTAAGNPADGDTVTIGATTYRFKDTIAQINDVLRDGATASTSLDNLIAAINAGAGAGTLYFTGTVANASVTAAAGAGDTVDLTAITAGTAGNSVATTEVSANLSFGGATLSGGEAAEAAYTVEIGASASDTLDNLIAAINAGAGAGTLYGTGTAAHPSVTAAAGTGDTMDVTAILAGTAGNSIATTETSTQLSWGAATLEGGVTSNNLQSATHGYDVGDGPFLVTSSGTRPGGLAADVLYHVKDDVDADNFTVAAGDRKAGVATITSDGSGTHTITKAASRAAVFDCVKKSNAVVVNAATDVDTL